MAITSPGTSNGQPAKSKRITVGRVDRVFQQLTERIARWTGSKWAVFLSILSVAIWAALGPRFGWSDSYQLIINTATTIITYNLVFIIQNTTNRETKALSVKLDELIRATETARNSMIGLEKRTEFEIEAASEEIMEAAKDEIAP